MDTLELAVAQAVHAAHLMERALHQPDGWEMEYSGQRFPVTRVKHFGHLHLRGTMPDQCWMAQPAGVIFLYVDGEMVSSRPIEHPGDGEHVFDWVLAVHQGALSA